MPDIDLDMLKSLVFALTPWLCLCLSPLIFIYRERLQFFVKVMFTIAVIATFVAYNNITFQMIEWKTVVGIALALGLAFALLTDWSLRYFRRHAGASDEGSGVILFLAFFLVGWASAYAALIYANALKADNVILFHDTVGDTRVTGNTSSRQSKPDVYLELSGDARAYGIREVREPDGVGRSWRVGSPVCVIVYRGMFGWRWYGVHPCNGRVAYIGDVHTV